MDPQQQMQAAMMNMMQQMGPEAAAAMMQQMQAGGAMPPQLAALIQQQGGGGGGGGGDCIYDAEEVAGAREQMSRRGITRKELMGGMHELARNDPSGAGVEHCLRVAAKRGFAPIVDSLHPQTGNTALICASYRGLPRVAAVLLGAGADVAVVTRPPVASTAVFFAAQAEGNDVSHGTEKDFVAILKLFQKRGVEITHAVRAGVRQPMLHIACENGSRRIVELLLRAGADVNERSSLPFSSAFDQQREGVASGGLTPLHMACSGAESREVVRVLLKAGADTRLRTLGRSAMLPIEHAMQNPRIMDELLRWEEDHGVDTRADERFPEEEEEGEGGEHGGSAASAMNMSTIRGMVARYRASGDVEAAMSMPLAGVVTSGGAERVAELQGRLAGEQAKRAKARGDAAAENRRDCANPACPRQAKQRIDLLACARCKAVRYCNAACQRAHWKAHKPACKKLRAVDE